MTKENGSGFDPNNEFVITQLKHDLRKEVDGEVRFDRGSRALYTTDASNYRQPPIGVVLPRTLAAVEATVAVCRRYGAPIINRGGGTALAGQSCNVAVMIDFSKYLNRILRIDAQRCVAQVEPGLNLDDLRMPAQEKYGLTYGPDPATHSHCTFGGMIGNNSCGIHSVMAGRTADNVEELEILTYRGQRMHVGRTSEDELKGIIKTGGVRGELYRKIRDLRDLYAPLIRARYPKIPRRVSGLNLDELLPENHFHVARALVGTESTCVTVLSATVRLVPYPKERTLLVLGYKDVYSAGDHIMEVMECKPIGLEGLDDKLVHYMKLKHFHTEESHLLPEGNGWLLVEFGGQTKDEADNKAQRCMRRLRFTRHPPSMKLYTDKAQEKAVWEVRESGLGATANVPTMPLSWPGWEDAAVPPERIGDYLREFRELLNKHRLLASLYGHFGQGCVHCRISFDMFTHQGVQNYVAFVNEAADLVVKYGGSLSAEHGDGQSRAFLLPKMYGPELVRAFTEFKEIWDPDWKMNPGKIVEPDGPLEHLRLGPTYNPEQPDTHFQFVGDNRSFPRATLRCVGVGKCRRPKDAFMCPSYLVTREERDTTRGRARTLFEMFHGDLIKDGWRSKEVLEALDLCLACKGCKQECPINVDMASWKAEFLSHYYEHRLRPRKHYSMGLIEYWAALAGHTPRFANFLGRAPLFGNITRWLAGISQQRPMPKFAKESFTRSFRRRKPQEHGAPRVLLFPDAFNDHFYPDSLHAAVDVLEHWGYQVEIPKQRVPDARPAIHYGMLALGKRHLRHALDLLHPYIVDGIPIVVLEPSTAAVFRDELLELMPRDEDAQRLALLVHLLSEFALEQGVTLPEIRGKAIFHGHCHQKAVLNVKAARLMLEKMGLDLEEPQPGCCGMAGSFGFESEHYGISMQVGELALLPTVRTSPRETFIVADGFSCRTQILDGTGRHALHTAELLQLAFQREEAAPARARLTRTEKVKEGILA